MSESLELLIIDCPIHGRVGPLGTVVLCGRCAADNKRLRDELLVALKSCVDVLIVSARGERDRALAAIAKAEGKDPT